MDEKQLAWLAGIVDGEGTITMYEMHTNRGYRWIRPIFQIINTNIDLMRKCQEIIGTITREPKINKKGKTKDWKSHYRPCYTIQITKQEDIKLICVVLYPYLIAKKKQAELMIEFIKIRQQIPKAKIKNNQSTSYTNGENLLLEEVLRLNSPKSVETNTPDTRNSEDRVRSIAKSIEAVRNAQLQFSLKN